MMARNASVAFGCGRSSSAVFGAMAAGLGAALACGLGGCATDPKSFATPDAAMDSLVAALRTDDQKELKTILGSDSKDLLSSGDAVADANGRAEFLRLYDAKHRLIPDGEDAMTLEVGAKDWPMPAPLIKGDKGWYFDTVEGVDEILSRRIGMNELYAIQVCMAIVDAEREYASADFDANGWREYAQNFKSAPGKRDGLYWPAAPGEPESPLGNLVASATEEGYGDAEQGNKKPRPFHGYLYRILTAQGPAAPGGAMDFVAQGHMIGGFGVVAWPAEYANSGLKTFITSYHGVVYEKDLGDDTDRIARRMKTFNPEKGWEICDTSIMP